ncbi:MAG: hypothetical protein PF588_03485 [Candidatus Kapabacteria bacterium]|jgi:hypothetical protein|nr:hypothetical protein [Candidatus Kapabacteria bacterium]
MEKKVCKHCGAELDKVLIPEESDWGVEYFFICMNDECGYFKRGWERMKEVYKVRASYRWKIDPDTGAEGPIPVKSVNDMKDWIVKRFNR